MKLPETTRESVGRIQERGLHEIIGRFKTVRRAYSFYQNKRQQSMFSDYCRDLLDPQESVCFKSVAIDSLVQSLHEKGVGFGLSLAPAVTQEIYQFACDSPCTEPSFERPFKALDVKAGQIGNRPVLSGLVWHPEKCAAVQQLAKDDALLQIAHDYLRYWPSQLTCHLTWSFASDIATEIQKQYYLPLNYHYDVAGYNFMTAYFYITDVDANSGAHVMIEKSHNYKSLCSLFLSQSRQSDRQILDGYGKENELVIEGKAGFGFMQDPSCYHKLFPARDHNRLLLQIRYS